MNQNEFILLNAGVVTLVVVYLLIARRKPARPVTLRLHDKDSKSPVPLTPAPPPGSRPGPPPNAKKSGERQLNITFHFDDRSHDAFEVLQIPAGSSAQAAQIAFNTLAQLTPPERLALLRAALAAILATTQKT